MAEAAKSATMTKKAIVALGNRVTALDSALAIWTGTFAIWMANDGCAPFSFAARLAMRWMGPARFELATSSVSMRCHNH
jgi:hypothetical protein